MRSIQITTHAFMGAVRYVIQIGAPFVHVMKVY